MRGTALIASGLAPRSHDTYPCRAPARGSGHLCRCAGHRNVYYATFIMQRSGGAAGIIRNPMRSVGERPITHTEPRERRYYGKSDICYHNIAFPRLLSYIVCRSPHAAHGVSDNLRASGALSMTCVRCLCGNQSEGIISGRISCLCSRR